VILPSNTSTSAPLIPFNSTDNGFQIIPQLRASVEEIKNKKFFSNNIIPTSFSLSIPITTLNMVLNSSFSEPTSVAIFNAELTNTTIARTDTFSYGIVLSFQSNFQCGTSP